MRTVPLGTALSSRIPSDPSWRTSDTGGGATGAARPDGGLGIVVVGTGVERRMRLLVYGVQKQEVLERFIDNLLVRIHFSIDMIRWTGLAQW